MTPARLNRLTFGGVIGHLAVALVVAALLAAPRGARAQDFVTLVADRLFIDGASVLVAEGNVEALFGTTRLQASRVVYDRRTGALSIAGPLVLNDGRDVIMLADEAELSDGMRRGLIRSARVVFDEQLQIAAASVERLDERFTEMTSVVASSCEVCANRPTPLWEIRARRVVHDEEALQVHFEGAQFRLFGLPVAYIPRLRVPDPRLERATGFLSPRLSFTSQHGFGLRAPYFIVLADDRDLLLTPFVSTQSSRALELRYRQAFAAGTIELGTLVARDRLRPGTTRGVATATGAFDLGGGYGFSFNLIAPSDRAVLDDYGRGQARLTSDITLERIERDARLRVQLLHFRSLRLGDDNRTLPNLVGQAVIEERRALPGLGGVASWRLEAQNQRRRAMFTGLPEAAPGLGAGPRPRQMGRLSLDLDWRRDAVLPGGVLLDVGLALGLDHVRLSDTGGSFPLQTSRATPQASLGLRWPLIRRDAGGVSHVIEPVAQVIYAPRPRHLLPYESTRLPEFDEGNLFALNRFASPETREGGLRANLGVSWTRHDPQGWSSTLTLGRIWRREDLGQFAPGTRLDGQRSAWLVAGSLDLGEGLSLSNRSLFGAGLTLKRTALELDWQTERFGLSTSLLRIGAIPFENRPNSSAEWRVDASRVLTDFWTGRAGWRYDIAQNRLAVAQLGLDFRNECLRMEIGLERRFDAASQTGGRTNFGLNIDVLGVGGNPSRTRRQCNDM